MPAQDGVGGEKSADLSQELAAKDFTFDGQTAALVVVQQDPVFAEFLSEHLVLGPEVINDLLLLLVDPIGEDEMKQLPGLKNEIHRGPGAVSSRSIENGPRPARKKNAANPR